jgi:hypothetical protein
MTCLSEFALDDLILNGPDEASRDAAAHLQDCEACRRRHDDRHAFVAEFERSLAGPFWQATRRRHEQRRRRRRALLLGLPWGLAAVCALVFLVSRAGKTPSAYLGAKGAAALEIHCRRDGRTFALRPDDAVAPGDELRFVPRPASAQARYVQIASIDGTHRYTPFYPSDIAASSLPLPPAGQPLDGSIRLDDAPGPERLFVVYSSVPLPAGEVEKAARQLEGGMHAVRDIAGAETESGWIMLAKTAAQGQP